MRSAHQRLSPSNSRGFTLVEIMVVVVIIGLLVALAVPAYRRIRRSSQNARIANDFRVFAQAFEIYNFQNGTWPNNIGAGLIPTLPVPMNGDFKGDAWTSPTPLGGKWNWDKGNFGFSAGISISDFTCDDEQLTELDAKFDDGILTSGNFQKVQPNRVMLIMEQ